MTEHPPLRKVGDKMALGGTTTTLHILVTFHLCFLGTFWVNCFFKFLADSNDLLYLIIIILCVCVCVCGGGGGGGGGL